MAFLGVGVCELRADRLRKLVVFTIRGISGSDNESINCPERKRIAGHTRFNIRQNTFILSLMVGQGLACRYMPLTRSIVPQQCGSFLDYAGSSQYPTQYLDLCDSREIGEIGDRERGRERD